MRYKSDHMCIKVTDLERSMEFYQKALGFNIETVIDHAPAIRSIFIKLDGNMKIQLLHLPNYQNRQIEFGHFGVTTEDIQSSYAFHKEMGCTSSGIQEQKHQYGYFICDPDGYETEIVQDK